jgi:hypothetical protein
MLVSGGQRKYNIWLWDPCHLFSFLCCVFGGVRVAHLFSFLCCVFGGIRVIFLVFCVVFLVGYVLLI